MGASHWVAQRRPPPSPSRSLVGLERAIPPSAHVYCSSCLLNGSDVDGFLSPRIRSPNRSSYAPSARTRSSGPSAEPMTPNKDKDLPLPPRRSSSVYTTDAAYRYTRIIDSYRPEERPDIPVVPVVQPAAYRNMISPLLKRGLEDWSSTKPFPAETSVHSLESETILSAEESLSELQPASYISNPPATKSRNVASFEEFSRGLPIKKTGPSQAFAPAVSMRPSVPEFRSVSYESTRRSESPDVSPRTSYVRGKGLVPTPSSLCKTSSTTTDTNSEANLKIIDDEEERCESHFSKSSTEDSFVIYTGVLDYFRHRIRKKREQSKKKEPRVRSLESARYSGKPHAYDDGGDDRAKSRRSSVPRRMSSIYEKFGRLSISGTFSQSAEAKQPRGRKKQRAIPTSPYQKYGAAVWEAKRPKEAQLRSAHAKSERGRYSDGQAGGSPGGRYRRQQAEGALTEGKKRHDPPSPRGKKRKLGRDGAERRRKALKMSIKMVGPAEEISFGQRTYPIR